MIRAIHFSAIALLAAASLIAATSAGSQGQIEPFPALSMLETSVHPQMVETAAPGMAPAAAGNVTGFGPSISGDGSLDKKMSFVTALIGDHASGRVTPNG
ncbi:MAG: hypothetical protein NXH97_04635 [Rhodobacteraceae bacterium]|nr:hypothetical protein [Paracoccaceae bacterium]